MTWLRSAPGVRFSLRTMLVTLTVLCIFLGYRLNNYQQMAASTQFVRHAGGIVGFGHPQSSTQSTFSEPQHGLLFRILVGNARGDEISTLALYDHRMPGGCNDGFLAQLARHRNQLMYLGELDFNGGDVTNDGIRHLAVFDQLEYLDLSNTHVDDGCVTVLATHKKLKTVSLVGTNISARGVNSLRKLLPSCQVFH